MVLFVNFKHLLKFLIFLISLEVIFICVAVSCRILLKNNFLKCPFMVLFVNFKHLLIMSYMDLYRPLI